MKKIIVLVVLSMFLLTSITSLEVVAKIQQNIIKSTEEGAEKIITVIEENITLNPTIKKVIKQKPQLSSVDN